MNLFETVEIKVPTSDVQKKDFRIILEKILLATAAIATIILINITFN